MNERRQQLVREAFQYLDANGNGTLQLDEIKASFNVRAHPEVVQGIRSAESVLSEFYETFQVLH
jgi:Ca2+-binding EF-hand superfamily protein